MVEKPEPEKQGGAPKAPGDSELSARPLPTELQSRVEDLNESIRSSGGYPNAFPPAWLIAVESAWTRLGTDNYPWYSQVRAYSPEAPGDWTSVMAAIATDLNQAANGGTRAVAAG